MAKRKSSVTDKEVIPCQRPEGFQEIVHQYAEELKQSAHTVGTHGLNEDEFNRLGLFRAAVERIRGQFAATTSDKQAFVKIILDYLKTNGLIDDWESAGEANRHDYRIVLPNGRVTIIEAKGCLDGNNTNIFDRPPHANEFLIWSLCQNTGSDPRHNVWSGIHTRLSAEIIDRSQIVDGLIVWDPLCDSKARPCPKTVNNQSRLTNIGDLTVPPPCIYLFADTIPSPRNNPAPQPQHLEEVQFLKLIHNTFKGNDSEVSYVHITARHHDNETERQTKLERDGQTVIESAFTAIRRA